MSQDLSIQLALEPVEKTWLVESSIGAIWFVTACNPREAMLKVLFWSEQTETAVRCEAL